MKDDSKREAVRKRPAMYLGTTDKAGVLLLVRELIEDVAEQCRQGEATFTEVLVDGDLISVNDDGWGLPFDEQCDCQSLEIRHEAETHHTVAEHILTSFWPPHSPYPSSLSSIQLGPAIINFLSEHLVVTSWRGGECWSQTFEKGVPVDKPAIIQTGNGRGTSMVFSIDRGIFTQPVDRNDVRELLRQTAFRTPGFRTSLNGTDWHAPNGLSDWCRQELNGACIEPFSFIGHDKDIRLQVSVAGLAEKSQTQWKSFANGYETSEGTHLETIRGIMNEVGLQPAIAIIDVAASDPIFSGQDHKKLIGPRINEPLKAALRSDLQRYLKS